MVFGLGGGPKGALAGACFASVVEDSSVGAAGGGGQYDAVQVVVDDGGERKGTHSVPGRQSRPLL